jgi:hypothetical protein
MSLTLIRRLVLACALSAAFLGAGLAQAEDEAPPVEVAVAGADVGPPYEDEGDFVYADMTAETKGALEKALTSVLGGCRPGLVAAKVTVIRNEIDPSSGYILVTALSDSERATQEKLTAGMLEACFEAMDAPAKSMLDQELATIMTQTETLLNLP